MFRQMIGGFFCVTIAALALAGCGLHDRPKVERKQTQGGPAPSGRPALLETNRVVAPGIVEPWDEQVNLSAQESGWIAQLSVKEGDRVEVNQLLAVLEDSAQHAEISLAMAGVAEAEAALARVLRGATKEELRQAEAEYEAAAARGTFSKTSEARTARLHEGGVVPDTAADEAATEARVQSALANSAEARLSELRRGARREDRIVARARVDAARARLEAAKAAWGRRRILAPKAATVLLSPYHQGEFFDVGRSALFVLGDLSRLQVRLEVDEVDALTLKVGARCALYSDAELHLGDGSIVSLAPKMGRRALPLDTPTARADVRVREAIVEIGQTSKLIVGQRVWGHVTTNPAVTMNAAVPDARSASAR